MKFKIVNKIKRVGYPTAEKDYPEAHAEADKAEKKKFPKEYQRMKKVDSKLSKDELAGTHTRSGKITLSKKVPKLDRKDVAYHEKAELSAQKRLQRK